MMPASAASRPETASTPILINPVRRPTARAAFSFDPTALIQPPAGVIDSTSWPAATTTAPITIRIDTLPTLPAIQAKPNGRGGFAWSGLM